MNRALGAIAKAATDIWESRYFANGLSVKRYAKRVSARARRRLDRAEAKQQIKEHLRDG